MKIITWNSLLAAAQKFAWVLFLVFLPVTNFPHFPGGLGGGTLVRPLSIFPLIVLLALVTLPRLFSKTIPRTPLALLPFVLVAVASSFLSLTRGIQPALGIPVTDRVIRALVTLGIGGAFYLTVVLTPRKSEDLRASMRWLYAGFSAALLWGSLQAIYVIKYIPAYYRWINHIQKYITTRRLFTMRISGLTYEPNWFAEQISFLLLPWLLASVLTGYSVFHWRWRWLTVEWFLLAWALAVLPFTFSRAGLMILIVLAFISLLFFRPHRTRFVTQAERKPHLWVVRTVEASLTVVLLIGIIYAAGSSNIFFSRLWDYWSNIKNTSLSGYLEYIGVGARLSYGEAAYHTYESYPIFGVGLGNYAYYFDQMLPDEPVSAMPEVLRLITPEPGRNRLITTKNLYLRLLAETGLVGAAAFLAFFGAILGCALYLWLSKKPEQKFWGTAGLLGLIAFALAALSFDSFAVPNMWVVFGLITSAAWIYSRPDVEKPQILPVNTDRPGVRAGSNTVGED